MQYRFFSSCNWLAFILLFLLPVLAAAQPKIQLQQYASGFNKPVDIAHCGDSRLFIVEQRGIIWVLDSLGNKQTTPFLDIDARVNSGGNEQGLLGLAFHPNFKTNGYFYVNYIKTNGDTRISRFSVTIGDSTTANPDSEASMMDIEQPFSNHNGGCIKFGPDGYLYISMGDGGSAGDPNGNGQNTAALLGKMLRIDVNVDTAPFYKAPDDNPFVNDPAYAPEIWSLGLRNVWRFSFDKLNGSMWMGDVGQNVREEIDFEPAGVGGRNYGWRCYEASVTYNTSGCAPIDNYIFPVYEYVHNVANGCSVTGGFIYRGAKYPDLYAKYIFPDYCSGRWWVIAPDGTGNFATSILANLSAYEYSSLGEDRDGELYVCGHGTGRIYKVKELCSGFSIFGATSNATCAGVSNGAAALTIIGAAQPYTVTWSTGATTAFLSDLAPGQYSVAVQDANQCVRRDTLTIGENAPIAGAPVVTFTGGVTALCNGAPVDIQATQPTGMGLSFVWFKDGAPVSGAISAVLTVMEPGVYTAGWINANNGCQSDASTGITINNESVVPFTLEYTGGVIVPDETVTGQWLFEGVAIPGAIDSVFTPLESGNYSLLVTSPNGCTFAADIDVIVSSTHWPYQVREFLVTPNPATTILQVMAQTTAPQTATVMLMDASGKIVREKTIYGDRLQCSFDLTDMPAGNYLCCLRVKEGVAVRKVIKSVK